MLPVVCIPKCWNHLVLGFEELGQTPQPTGLLPQAYVHARVWYTIWSLIHRCMWAILIALTLAPLISFFPPSSHLPFLSLLLSHIPVFFAHLWPLGLAKAIHTALRSELLLEFGRFSSQYTVEDIVYPFELSHTHGWLSKSPVLNGPLASNCGCFVFMLMLTGVKRTGTSPLFPHFTFSPLSFRNVSWASDRNGLFRDEALYLAFSASWAAMCL